MSFAAYSASNLEGLVNEQGIAPHVPVIDKSQRRDGTFAREDFSYDGVRDVYTCPAGKALITTGHVNSDHARRYLAAVPECRACPLKPKCCPNMRARRIVRDVNEAARDLRSVRAVTPRSQKGRDAIRAHQAHSAARPIAPARTERSGLSSRWQQSLQNLRRLVKLVARPPRVTSMVRVA
jgi:hypothetical protein